jgi:hypothetical protein
MGKTQTLKEEFLAELNIGLLVTTLSKTLKLTLIGVAILSFC